MSTRTNVAELMKLVDRGQLDPGQVQPSILAHQNINLNKVEKWWSCHLNDSWAPKINEKIGEGYIVIRVQTELDMNGHSTMIYMVKMKAE